MELSNSKKIIILGIILLVIAGIIVVSLKGFNVSLNFGKHESIELKVGKEVNIDTIKEIAQEIFPEKEYDVKELEVFGDSFQINVKSVTDEEKNHLIEKVNEKFEVTKTIDDLKITSVSNQRIRDVVMPYFMPMLIVFIVVYLYMLIRFRKINISGNIRNNIFKIILTEAILYSLIAIIRIPVSSVIINISMIIAIAELVCCVYKSEEKLSDI